jgi:spore coat polysaccharide biosynthesis predicted glycosyltransferase SpsG
MANNSTSLIFVAQATPQTGSGHVMRFLPLETELRKRGVRVDLYGEMSIPWMKRSDSVCSHFDSLDADNAYGLAITDSYELNFLKAAHSKLSADRWIQIADSFTPLFPGVETIWLDPSPPKDNTSVNFIASGLKYFPVNTLSASIPGKEAKSVVIQLGGIPNVVLLDAVLSEISQIKYRHIDFRVFGETSLRDLPKNIRLYALSPSILGHLENCDTVICGAGTSLWESVMNHRIVGVLEVVKNQSANYSYLLEKKVALGLGYMREEVVLDSNKISQLLLDGESRERLYRNATRCFDNLGAVRLADKILYTV